MTIKVRLQLKIFHLYRFGLFEKQNFYFTRKLLKVSQMEPVTLFFNECFNTVKLLIRTDDISWLINIFLELLSFLAPALFEPEN